MWMLCGFHAGYLSQKFGSFLLESRLTPTYQTTEHLGKSCATDTLIHKTSDSFINDKGIYFT